MLFYMQQSLEQPGSEQCTHTVPNHYNFSECVAKIDNKGGKVGKTCTGSWFGLYRAYKKS